MSTRVKTLVLIVLVAGMSLAGAACGKYSISNLRALKAFQDANELYKKGDFKAAAARYQDVIRLNPDLGYAYFFLGNSYDNMYKPSHKGEKENDDYLAQAVETYRQAIDKLQGTEARYPEFRKRSFEYLIAAYGPDKLNDLSQAEPIAKELIAMDPSEPTNYQALGKMFEDAGRYDEAEAMFKKAVEARPNDGVGWSMLAGYYNRQGQFDKTMEAWQERAKVEPNNPDAWHTMATYFWEKAWKDKTLSLAVKKDYVERGLDADDKALKLNPDYVEALTYKGILLRLKAGTEKDPAAQNRLIQEADMLRDKAMALQKKQAAAAKAGK